jgi:hypothetical protein
MIQRAHGPDDCGVGGTGLIDLVQPPGIGISPIADMDVHQTIARRAGSEERR